MLHVRRTVPVEPVARHTDRMTRADPSPTGHDLEATILELLARRASTSTICPSDAARAVGGESWRDLMEPVRAAARRLEAEGLVDIMQRGEVVDPASAKGPIRIRRRPSED